MYSITLLAIASLVSSAATSAHTKSPEPGTPKEPLRYVGNTKIDPVPHDAALRPAIGTANYQVMRANRTHPERADDYGWTYNHAPMLAYWNNTFYLEYLSNPVDEHIAPGQTLLSTSPDGRTWSKPTVVFPHYTPPPGTPLPKKCTGYMMHQRMGFYTAPNGRLLVLAFYGHTEDPFEKGGIGRVVREAYKDGTFGPIYFIRYTSHMKWNETNTSYPLYTRSTDEGFVAACKALLADRLMTLQWRDEDHGLDGFYNVKRTGEAFCWYHRKDGNVVGLWKWSLAALSTDGGETFSAPVKLPTIIMDGAKIWGQRTSDGRYALVYNPVKYSEHRYPLAVITSDDGILFDNMLLVHGEVPPRRFYGRWKDFGQQYIRGIEEGNGTPPDGALWLTYSMNKEDIWVSRVPVPIISRVEGPVHDTFDAMPTGAPPAGWNVHCPQWASVQVADVPSAQNKSLEMCDRDPCDYAKAVRVFQETNVATIGFRLMAKQADAGVLDIEVLDHAGKRPIRLTLADDGHIKTADSAISLGPYRPDTWHTIEIRVDTAAGTYDASLDGNGAVKNALLAEPVVSVERLCFRTGPYRAEPTRETINEIPHPPLPGADDPVPERIYYVDDVMITPTQQ